MKNTDVNSSVLPLFRRILTRTCLLYTVLFFSLFVFIALFDVEQGMSFGQALLILLCSFLISASAEIFRIAKLHIFAKIAINYAVLLTSFLIVFVIGGKIIPDKIFIAVILFTFFYAIALTAVILVRGRLMKNGGSNVKKAGKEDKNKEGKYKNRFS